MRTPFSLIYSTHNADDAPQKSHIPLTTLGLDLFSGTYLNKLVLLQCSLIEGNSI